MEDTKFVEIDGEQVEVRELANGSLARVDNGQFVTGATIPDPSRGGLITRDTAGWMQSHRGQKAALEARQAVLAAVQKKHPEIEIGEAGWGLIIKELAAFALDGELLGKGKKLWSRERLEAIKLLGRATRFLSSEKADELAALRAKEINIQTNYFADNPEFTSAFLDARCPDCRAVREYGVAHDCPAELKEIMEGEVVGIEDKPFEQTEEQRHEAKIERRKAEIEE